MATPEDLFTSTLDRHADSVEAPTRRFAHEAHRAATRIRRRRRVTGMIAAALLVVAVPISLGLSGLGSPDKSFEPAETHPPAPRTVTIDPDELPRGLAPSIPWFESNTLHDGAVEADLGEIRLGAKDSYFVTRNGYLTYQFCCEDRPTTTHETRLLDKNGGLQRTLPGEDPFVSPDGRTVAMTSGSGFTLTLFDTENGAAKAETDVPTLVRVVGFVGEKVLYTAVLNDAEVLDASYLWDPETGTKTAVGPIGSVGATDGQRLVAVTVPSEQSHCGRVVGLDDRSKVLWERCPGTVTSISPDGRYATAQVDSTPQDATSVHAMDLLVYDLTERRLVSRLQSYTFGQVVWESADRLLLVLDGGTDGKSGRTAIVRCTVTGDCERATEVRSRSQVLPPVFLLPGRPG